MSDIGFVGKIKTEVCFILGKGINDALKRANAYSKAGADGILIHSKIDTPKEILSPIICLSSTVAIIAFFFAI